MSMPPGSVVGFFDSLGRFVLSFFRFVLPFFEYIGALASILFETFSWIARGSLRPALTVQQMSILGVSSLGIVLVTNTFVGLVLALELGEYAVRYGVANYAGGGVALSMVREFAPMLTAITVAGRAGSAITAEIATMKVTEQIDALRAMGTSPIRYLVVPRFLACLVMMPLLTIFAGVGGTLGGAVSAHAVADIQYATYFDSISITVVPWDVWSGLVKAVVFGGEIALIACLQGLTTEGGAAGVGKSTTNSVVNSTLLVFITNYFLSASMYPPVGT